MKYLKLYENNSYGNLWKVSIPNIGDIYGSGIRLKLEKIGMGIDRQNEFLIHFRNLYNLNLQSRIQKDGNIDSAIIQVRIEPGRIRPGHFSWQFIYKDDKKMEKVAIDRAKDLGYIDRGEMTLTLEEEENCSMLDAMKKYNL